MRTTIKRKVTLSVDVILEVEYSNLPREAAIVHAKLAEDNMITPRMVNAAMQKGDYASMDTQTHEAILEDAIRQMMEYKDVASSNMPEKEIRSVPIPIGKWERVMTSAAGTRARLPLRLVVEYFGRFKVFAEPVLCRIPTVYIWEIERGSGEIEKSMSNCESSLNHPELKQMEDGSLRMQWTKLS